MTQDNLGLSRPQIATLVRLARKYTFASGEYRSTPPERSGGYVSGSDVERWPGQLASFRDRWEALSEKQRVHILRRAHARDCREWTVEMYAGMQRAVVSSDGLAELEVQAIYEEAPFQLDAAPHIEVPLYFWSEQAARQFIDNHPQARNGIVRDLAEEGHVRVRWMGEGEVLFADLAHVMKLAMALAPVADA